MQKYPRTILILAGLLCAGTLAQAGDIRIGFESPKDAYYSGVGNVRGWAVSSAGIDRVELYIDDAFISLLPQGGARPDVAAVFPDFPNAQNAGFAIAFNYSVLATGVTIDGNFFSTVGIHEATVRVVDNDGATLETANVFGNSRFLTDSYYFDSTPVSFDSITRIESAGSGFTLSGVFVDGVSYDVTYQWLPEAQQSQPALILLTSEAQKATGTQPQSGNDRAVKQLSDRLAQDLKLKRILAASHKPFGQ